MFFFAFLTIITGNKLDEKIVKVVKGLIPL